jgi:branched-chain amino acid transport system permease protein
MLGCFIVGLGLGFPALRVQTIYLAFATLGFNTALWLVMRNEEWLTGGTFGINNIARPELFGLSLNSNLSYYYFVLGVAVVMCALLWKLLSSPWGKAFTALRDNPIRAESLGINIQAYTLLSFAIGAVYAGVAGALFAPLVQFIEPAPFTVGASIMMYLMVVVGGAGLLLRAAARLGGRRDPAGVAALRPGLVSVRVRHRGGAADALAARRSAVDPRQAARPAQAREASDARAAAAAKIGAQP